MNLPWLVREPELNSILHGALVGAGSLQTQERFEVGTLKWCAKHT